MTTKHVHIHLPARQLGKTKDSPVQSMVGAARVAKLAKALGISLPAAQKKLERADWNYERALGTKDADNTKYILKKDTLIEGMGGGNQNANRTGRIVPAGTVFYKWGGKFTPYWAKTGPGISWLTESMFQVEKSSYDAKDSGSTSSLEALEDELDKLQDDIEDLEDKGRSASQAQINRRKALNLQINELKKKE